MQIIIVDKTKYKGPSGWADISAADLLCIGKLGTLKQINEVNLYFLIVMLFHIPVKEFNKLRRFQKSQLKKTVNWLYKSNELSNWLLAGVRVGNTRLYGPQNSLSDLTAEEFMFCEGAYERWLHTDDPEHLDTLFGILYRKRRFFTKKRRSFSPENDEKQLIRAKKAKDFVKRAVALNYAGCRNLIISKHPNIWIKNDNQADPGAPKLTNWASMILELAGDKFGTYQQTIQTNIWLLLADMNKKAKAAAPIGGSKA